MLFRTSVALLYSLCLLLRGTPSVQSGSMSLALSALRQTTASSPILCANNTPTATVLVSSSPAGLQPQSGQWQNTATN